MPGRATILSPNAALGAAYTCFWCNMWSEACIESSSHFLQQVQEEAGPVIASRMHWSMKTPERHVGTGEAPFSISARNTKDTH